MFGRRGSNANADGRSPAGRAASDGAAFVAWPLRARAVGERRAFRTAAAVPAEADERSHAAAATSSRAAAPFRMPSPSRPPARLLDQRLQVRDTLLEIAILLDLGPARRCGDGHGDSISNDAIAD